MRKKILALAALPLALAFLGGCGGSGHSTPPPSNNVPVVVSISDTTPAAGEVLPTGVNLVSVQATVTGVCLLTSSDTGDTTCPTGQTIFPASGGGPSTVQFSALSNPSQLDVVANAAVTANTYVGAFITFSSPISATVSVDPGANFTDGTNSCDNTNAVGTPPIFCQLSPVVSATSATVTFPSAITLTAGTPASFIVGLDVTGSLVSTGSGPATLSFNPIVSVTQGAVGADGNLIDVNNVSGTVSSISATSITLTDNATGLPLTLNIGSSTTVTNYNTCATPNTIACVQLGDFDTLSYSASNTNPVQFTADNIAGNPGITSAGAFQGTIVETGATPEVVVTAVPAGNIIGISVGQVLGLGFTGTAVFSNSTGAALPAGSSFAAPGDLVVGQNVFIDACPLVAGVATCAFVPPVVGPPAVIGSVTADAIELLPGNVSGTFTAPAAPNFTVTGLNSFYTGNGVTSLTGTTSASTTYSGTVSGGFSSLTVGNTYFYTGYLANSGTPATPNLLTTGIFGTE